jgi:hypothetical protein
MTDQLADGAETVGQRSHRATTIRFPNRKGSTASEKSLGVHNSDHPDPLVRQADLSQVGDRISDVKKVAEWVA